MPRVSRLHSCPRRQRGAGLIEVLMAVLVMGIGLLGIAAMQATALRNNQSSLERTQATIQTYSILDAMRANRERALAGDYDMGLTCATPTVPPSGATLAQSDKRQWFLDMQRSMGNDAGTCGTIVRNGENFEITVQWDDSRAANGQNTNADRNQVITRVRL
ncbi:type IV pilus modification protein PilV [Pseudoxanthomonas sp. UTMC 1351]|uniref:type IV pilus modification protein PilV n=1 Tax=Pseudoxanthomonas sp. UTMC 1351 TaxID=2695853 RepID=UPI0034CD949E